MIYTSYWGNLKKLTEIFGKENIISVSRWCRFWNGKRCSKLFPSVELLKGFKKGEITEKEYTTIFNEYLETLNVDNCYKVLNGCVLVCYEKEGFCHRHLIREWLNRNGYECEEWKGIEMSMF